MENIKDKIHELEYSFAKKLIFLLLLKQIIIVLSDLYFVGSRYLFYDVVLILTVTPCYVFTLVSENYNFQKVGKFAVGYLMLLNIIFSIVYYEDFPSVISYIFMFPVALMFYYDIRKSIYSSAFFFFTIPLSLLYNYYFVHNVEKSDPLYYNFSNTYTVACAFILFSVCFYYLIQIQKLKAVLVFLEENTVTIDSFPILEKKEKIRLVQESFLEDTDLPIPFYEDLFSKIEDHMKIQKPWRNPDYNLKQLAKDVNSNTQYVSSAINSCTRNNFKSYLNDFRLNAFIALINNKNEEFSLEDVYLTIGFYNRSTFNRVFKSKFQMTPQEYISSKSI